MKKIFKILLCFIIIIIIGVTFKLVYPTLNKTHKFEELNMSFKCPNHYERLKTEKNEIIFSSNRDGIKIAIYKFKKDYLGKDDIMQKMQKYKEILEAMNYECVLEKTQMEKILVSNIESGKISIEVKSINQLNKEITLIIPTEEHDLVFSVYGVNDRMVENEKQVEKILNSVKIK